MNVAHGDASGRTLLFVHAHPDDESSKSAATAARYVDAGARVVLVTCTGGEAGDVLNPSFDLAEQAISAVRAAELDCACRAIGFSHRYELGYHDSGFHEDPTAVPEGTFARTTVDEPAGALAAVLRAERPDVVVTYPEDGGYPHPDHIMVHVVTMRGVELAADPAAPVDGDPWDVPRLLANGGFPSERVIVLHEALIAAGVESPFEGWQEYRAHYAPQPTHFRIAAADWFERRDEALRCHASQVDPDGFWFQVPRELEREVFPWETFAQLRPDPGSDPPERDDLFAGLA